MSFLTTPSELLPSIFSYACVDTGRTGCVLNLVCKTFRDVCLDTGVDIQCASVCGLARMEVFQEMLCKRESANRKITSLFLSSEQDADGHRSSRDALPRAEQETGIMLQILHTISPLHLRILHLRFPSAPKPFTLIPTPFPALVDLRIEGLLNSLELFSHSPICPTLKRLYIGPYVQVPERFGEALERVCPNLTHLRIQSPEQETGKHHLLQFVHAYCKRHEPLSTIIYSQDSEDSRRPENDESVPPSLCRIIIEFYAFVDYDETVCTPGWHRFYEPLEEYYKLTAAESNVLDDDEVSSERTLLLLPTPGGPHGPAEREQYLTQKLRIAEKEWLERTSGTGPGCWMPARVAGIGPILWMGDFQVSV